ncbi:ABC transporter permease [Granulicella sp. S190]|uniref:ABC transporter permease n=1 Tax=Granulicella sp. S190 TaxID=1747226 RepID=UPI00131CA181|nr:ABC transporter permease [Granulicella sp. S190]
MQQFVREIRYSLRSLLRAPQFALSTILVLGIGLAAVSCMSAILAGTLYRQLPYDAPENILLLKTKNAKDVLTSMSASDVAEWKLRSRTVREFGYFQHSGAFMATPSGELQISLVRISPGLFGLLARSPSFGRGFLANEYLVDRNDVAVISDTAKSTLFGSSRDVLGKEILIDGTKRLIVGVMPSNFRFPAADSKVQVWIPLVLKQTDLERPAESTYTTVARKEPWAKESQVQDELSHIQAQLAPLYAETMAAYLAPSKVVATKYRDELVASQKIGILALTSITLLVWLVACSSAVSLIVARGAAQLPEMILRIALGANRTVLLGRMLIDSIIISTSASIVGIFLAWILLYLIKGWLLENLIGVTPYTFDYRVFGTLVLFCICSTIVFSVVPAILTSNKTLPDLLSSLGGRSIGSKRFRRIQSALVVMEIGFSIVALVTAGTIRHTIHSLHSIPLGFDPENVLIVRPRFPIYKYRDLDPRISLYEPLLTNIRSLRGVSEAAIATSVPLSTNFTVSMKLGIGAGNHSDKTTRVFETRLLAASPGLKDVFRLSTASGRFFTTQDRPDTQPVAVVNNAFKKLYEEGGDSVERFSINIGQRRDVRIIGVLNDFQDESLSSPPGPEIILNEVQLRPSDDYYDAITKFHVEMAVRLTANGPASKREIGDAVRRTSLDLQESDVSSMKEVIDEGLSDQIRLFRLVSLTSLMFLVISGAGLYSLLNYVITLRSGEMALRIAFGARMHHIYLLALRIAFRTIALGSLFGVTASIFVVKFIGVFVIGAPSSNLWIVANGALMVLVFGLASVSLVVWKTNFAKPAELLKST